MSVEEANMAPSGSLSDRTARQLEQIITERDLKPGDRLPTVQDLSRKLGVSLSVVREAIASLRAGGVLHTRRGAGIFVAEPSAIDNRSLFFGDLSQISSVVEILELRLAVEVEAAGLAAERHSMAQESRIYEAYEAIQAVIKQGGTGEAEDSLFHIAIAEATNNRRFVDFLTQLGNAMIPRNKLRPLPASREEHVAYLSQLQDEHRIIVDAISGKDPDAARNAMRAHLSSSRDRYHSMIRAKNALR